jgi:hypothetical protein
MAFTDHLGPRTQPAWDAILDLLDTNDWVTHGDLLDAATNASDLVPKSIEELIRKGYRAGHYTRRTQKLRTITKLESAVYRRSPR